LEQPDNHGLYRESFQSINLFAYLHRTYTRSYRRSAPCGNYQGTKYRPQFSHQRKSNQRGDIDFGRKLLELISGLESDNYPTKKEISETSGRLFKPIRIISLLTDLKSRFLAKSHQKISPIKKTILPIIEIKFAGC
jgi:hypothetical protein